MSIPESIRVACNEAMTKLQIGIAAGAGRSSEFMTKMCDNLTVMMTEARGLVAHMLKTHPHRSFIPTVILLSKAGDGGVYVPLAFDEIRNDQDIADMAQALAIVINLAPADGYYTAFPILITIESDGQEASCIAISCHVPGETMINIARIDRHEDGSFKGLDDPSDAIKEVLTDSMEEIVRSSLLLTNLFGTIRADATNHNETIH